jgi:hypothetical protein
VRFPFREVPDPGSSQVRPRPIIDVIVEGVDIAPQACLLDSGATAIRFDAQLADVYGIDLTGAPTANLGVGGALVTARQAEVSLHIADADDAYEWTAPVWFCEPWTPAFGLLGLTGFFDHFVVAIASYEEWIELTPVHG